MMLLGLTAASSIGVKAALRRLLVGPLVVCALNAAAPCQALVPASIQSTSVCSYPLLLSASATETQIDFKTFLSYLDDGKVEKVVFQGIRPESLLITVKDSKDPIEVREGFPGFGDPLSPSGPEQVLARVKAAVGVKWEFDLSALQAIRSSHGIKQ